MRSVGVPEVDGKMAELGVDVLRAVVAKLSQPGAILPVLHHALHVRKKEHQIMPLEDCHAILKFLSDNMEAIKYVWVWGGILLITKFVLKLKFFPLKHTLVLQWNEK